MTPATAPFVLVACDSRYPADCAAQAHALGIPVRVIGESE